jgi:hypothetical protein
MRYKVKEGGKAGVTAGIIYAVTVAALEYTFKSSILKMATSEVPSGATTVNVNVPYD